jgi:hypothetical protein
MVRMDDENQTFIPDSFIALYRDSRQRLTLTKAEIATRYEFSEDMASMLVDTCQTIHFRDGVNEDEVLARCLKGLVDPPTQMEPGQAGWVIHRAAELLGWAWPAEG